MASPRKSSTEIISDALKYEKLANNQKDTTEAKWDAILKIESHIQMIAIALKSLLGKLSALLNDIETKQSELASAKTNKDKLAIKKLIPELQALEIEKINLSRKVQELKLEIIAAQEKIRPPAPKKPQTDITASLSVVELIIQQDQEKLRKKLTHNPKKPVNTDEDLPVDSEHPQAKQTKRCTIL
ncbi:MAG: hypothetical protein WAW86_06415 [Gammaproteobacteria bacterium]